MHRPSYRYKFHESVSLDDVRDTLDLAILSVESIHGGSRVQLEARYAFDAVSRMVAIDADTPLGDHANRLFIGYARKEFGPEAFTVERIGAPESHGVPVTAEAAA